MVITEDTGKEFEMAICYAKNIEYKGKYKYTYILANKLQSRLSNALSDLTLQHTAEKGSRYDFSSNETIHISAKTTKKQSRVAPQVIGQSSPEKLCAYFCISYTTPFELKKFIYDNPQYLLKLMEHYTFENSEIVYYNLHSDTLLRIKKISDIICDIPFKWTRDLNSWNNSITFKVEYEDKYISLFEVQFHTKSRKNLAIRWFFENLLLVAKDSFKISKF